jgi:hypothetical protein
VGVFQQYKIDFENGTIPIGNLIIGAWVFDPSYLWELCTGYDHTSEGVKNRLPGSLFPKIIGFSRSHRSSTADPNC